MITTPSITTPSTTTSSITTPCIPVPSPQDIERKLFPNGHIAPRTLPVVWNAAALLTPFGGAVVSAFPGGDQLVIGNVTYDASDPNMRLMRVGLYRFESLHYYDLFFATATANGQTRWWWLVSDPGHPERPPAQAIGPFTTTLVVPPPDFLSQAGLTHRGTWELYGRACDAFAGRSRGKTAGTWYWFDAASKDLARIMNIDPANDFQVPILGAYYLVDIPQLRTLAASNLADVYRLCTPQDAPPARAALIVTLPEILAAMAAAPAGASRPCTLQQIQALFPGIHHATAGMPAPSWTHQVRAESVQIDQHYDDALYSQLWYDFDRGTQVTVFVGKDPTGAYSRFDQILPRGSAGPMVLYDWNGSAWTLKCCYPGGSVVGMPRPDFVRTGTCRAVLKNNPYLGNLAIWSVRLDQGQGWTANFWFWFNEHERQLLFSLAPPTSLTSIDYQSFVRDAAIDACVLIDPCAQLPACPGAHIASALNAAPFHPIA